MASRSGERGTEAARARGTPARLAEGAVTLTDIQCESNAKNIPVEKGLMALAFV